MTARPNAIASSRCHLLPLCALLLGLGLGSPSLQAADDTAPATATDQGSPAPTESADSEPMRVIEVTGLRAVPSKSYKAMVAAEQAYHQHKAALAPDSQFLFAVLPPEGEKLAANFALRVRLSSGREVPITFVRGKMFKLPVLPEPDPDAELVSNHKGKRLRIGMHLRTPGIPMGSMRLGDVRLNCEVDEVLDADERSWLSRMIVRNRCTSTKANHKQAPFGAAATLGARVRDGEREASLPAFKVDGSNGRIMYGIPMADTSWSNDALLIFDYRTSPPATLAEDLVVVRTTGLKSTPLPVAAARAQ